MLAHLRRNETSLPTFSRITSGWSTLCLYILLLMIPRKKRISLLFFPCHSTSAIIFIKMSFTRFIFFSLWTFYDRLKRGRKLEMFSLLFLARNNVHNHFCEFAFCVLCRVFFLCFWRNHLETNNFQAFFRID